jgi:hypothetical protein
MLPKIQVLFCNYPGAVKSSVGTSKTRTVSQSGDSETETITTYYTTFEEDIAAIGGAKRTGSQVVTSTVSKTQTSQQATIVGASVKPAVVSPTAGDKIASPVPATSPQAVPTSKVVTASSTIVPSGASTKSLQLPREGEILLRFFYRSEVLLFAFHLLWEVLISSVMSLCCRYSSETNG